MPPDTPGDALPSHPQSPLQRLKTLDATRPDLPGEHLIVFAAGILLMAASMRSRTVLRRALLAAASTALIGRAASGTGGIARLARAVKTFR